MRHTCECGTTLTGCYKEIGMCKHCLEQVDVDRDDVGIYNGSVGEHYDSKPI